MSEDQVSERKISFAPGLPAIPERLLIAHAQGRVLFITGAGVSKSSGLPDFRELVVQIYESLDPATHAAITKVPAGVCSKWDADLSSLNDQQSAEVKRFIAGDYDVVLGMLERRIDGEASSSSQVRRVMASRLRLPHLAPASIHRSLMKLSDRGGATTVVTTNFDRLLEKAVSSSQLGLQTYALGGIPRPGYRDDFSGVLHIHGVLEKNPARTSEVILSDQDFGEFYLRRRVVPDFIYDAARLYHLVLVGYSANDAPMRYLLNAVAADGTRFGDLKERFAFVGVTQSDPVSISDWQSRGITPIQYLDRDGHAALIETLGKWSTIAPSNRDKRPLKAQIKRIVRNRRDQASDSERDLFDHLFRRSNASERRRMSEFVSGQKADFEWLDAMIKISAEIEKDRRP